MWCPVICYGLLLRWCIYSWNFSQYVLYWTEGIGITQIFKIHFLITLHPSWFCKGSLLLVKGLWQGILHILTAEYRKMSWICFYKNNFKLLCFLSSEWTLCDRLWHRVVLFGNLSRVLENGRKHRTRSICTLQMSLLWVKAGGCVVSVVASDTMATILWLGVVMGTVLEGLSIHHECSQCIR